MTHADLENRQIALWGFGREGRASYDYLRRLFPDKPLTLIDQHPPEGLEQDANLTFIAQKDIPSIVHNLDLVIKSPGISLYSDQAVLLKNNGVEITSATNLWFSQEKDSAATIIAITGSNGKSTTSALLVHILKSLGKKVLLGGNIGTALLSLERDADYYVVELSSYQTADLEHAPHVALLLNLFPEHIQWHQSHEQYFHDKLNLLQCGAAANIINYSDPLSRAHIKDLDKNLWFNHPDGLHYDKDYILNGRDKIGPVKAVKLPGLHNLENLCAALSVCEILGLDLKECFNQATSFKGLEHRLENLGYIGRHNFINDSISTTPEATIAALKAFPGQALTLIAGGQDRGQDYALLAHHLAQHPINALITAYETGEEIQNKLRQHCPGLPLYKVENLEKAVHKAKEITPEGGIILMSPAAPSYDAFKNFEERGNKFKKLSLNKKL